jgi:hypothetical protein
MRSFLLYVVISLLLFFVIHSMAHFPASLLRIFHSFLSKLTEFQSAGSTHTAPFDISGSLGWIFICVMRICVYRLAVLIQFKNRKIWM